jgi:hypothetical protein
MAPLVKNKKLYHNPSILIDTKLKRLPKRKP